MAASGPHWNLTLTPPGGTAKSSYKVFLPEETHSTGHIRGGGAASGGDSLMSIGHLFPALMNPNSGSYSRWHCRSQDSQPP